ncbi:MAG: winged helix-turn-helix transcriptional regulator [Chitinispirillaceae bacterium]|nr:winged helix-turn-helix transcriptional regulator [Chitinispirillaceae bacterium]
MVTVFSTVNKRENVVENVVEKKRLKETSIIRLMRQNNNITASEIAITLKLSERTVQRYIRKFVDENKVKRIGSDKGGYWEVQ